MDKLFSNKNKQLLQGGQNMPTPCTCLPGECPLNGECVLDNVIYHAKLETQNQEVYEYIGLTEKTFIDRYRKHTSSFRVHDPRNATSLSKKVLELQRKHVLFDQMENLRKIKILLSRLRRMLSLHQ